MDGNRKQMKRQEQMTKFILTLVFLAIFAAFIVWITGRVPNWQDLKFSALDLVLLALATFRLGRMIAYDLVMEPLRSPFARTVPDGSGAGDTVEPHGRGARRAFGELLSCPICVGTWVAALLVYALYLFPGPARVLVTFVGVVGAAELLNALAEALCWSGQLSRSTSGKQYSWHSAPEPDEEERRPAQSKPVAKGKHNGHSKP